MSSYRRLPFLVAAPSPTVAIAMFRVAILGPIAFGAVAPAPGPPAGVAR